MLVQKFCSGWKLLFCFHGISMLCESVRGELTTACWSLCLGSGIAGSAPPSSSSRAHS